MTAGLVLGCLFGASVCTLVAAIWPPRPRLATAAARWSKLNTRSASAWRARSERPTGRYPAVEGLRALIDEALSRLGVRLPHSSADLEITGRILNDHVAIKILLAAAGLLAPSVLVGCLALAGVPTGVAVPAILGLLLGVVLFWMPDLRLRQAAATRRHELRRALACYLDLVSMSLAGGRGVPEALPSAARIGTGWAFTEIQRTLERARYAGMTPWAAFAELGDRYDMSELQDLGGSLQLVADDGAKVRASLAARASTQRRRRLAETEGEASKADESIQLAQVVLAIGFFLFLGYPAVVAVLGI